MEVTTNQNQLISCTLTPDCFGSVEVTTEETFCFGLKERRGGKKKRDIERPAKP